MSNKKTIVHIIHNLGRGGAETLLMSVLKKLKDHNNIVVTLSSENEFDEQPECEKYYSLKLSSYYLFWTAVPKLRGIIRKHKAAVVHSHLYFSTLLARLAVPKNVALVSTIHASVSETIEYKKWFIRLAEKATYKFRPGILIGVSRNTINDYYSYLNIQPREHFVLYNFIDMSVFDGNAGIRTTDGSLKMIAVGSLKVQKNHQYLVSAMTKLKDQPALIDIYGNGALRETLAQNIAEKNVAVTLKGQVPDIAERLKEYDVFVLSSLYEGFSLAVLEAMAMKKALLLSDTTTFREQCDNTAFYFSLDDENDFVKKAKVLIDSPEKIRELGQKGFDRLHRLYMPEHHMAGLRNIYETAIAGIKSKR